MGGSIESSSAENESVLKKLGPGLITGAADDDPSGIATYCQAGAQFGFHMLWSVLITYPLMVAIQIISARIGRVTGQGLAANISKFYPPWILYLLISLFLIANTINIAADVAAMGDSMVLIVGGSAKLYALLFGLFSLLLQVFIPYRKYVYFLKWLTLSLLAYFGTAFVLKVPWGVVLHVSFLPKISWHKDYVTTTVAVFGTTISPYLFFWQASQEVEEENEEQDSRSLKEAPQKADFVLRRIRLDNYIGMGFSNLVAFFVILSASLTLHQSGLLTVQTSAEAAKALKPIAGEFAFLLFSLGIIGTGLLAIPVLAGSAAYAVAESFHWKSSLELKPYLAKKFYSIIAVATLVGVGLGFTSINPIQALYWSAVINGVISVPIMVIMMLMAARSDIMGEIVIHRTLKILGWGAILLMLTAVVGMFL